MNREIIVDELTVLTSRSGGKGGQHVNKTESKVELIWSVETSRAIDEDERLLLQKNLASKIMDGKIHVISQTSRSQIKNREEAVKKLMALIEKGLIRPKKRKPTKISKAAKEKRLEGKKHRKDIKASRRKIY